MTPFFPYNEKAIMKVQFSLNFQDPAEALRQHFQAYAAFGKDRHKDGSHITLSQIDRWFKQAQVIDGDTLTTTDTGIVFKKISG